MVKIRGMAVPTVPFTHSYARLPERFFGRRVVLPLQPGEAEPVQGLRIPGTLRQRRDELRFSGGGVPLTLKSTGESG